MCFCVRAGRARARGSGRGRRGRGRTLEKGDDRVVREAMSFLGRFGLDEIDNETSLRAAALRRQRAGLKSPDAIILASAQIHGRVLITRNIRDFPANMPGIHVPYTL